MRWADIEVPNLPVDVNSWGRSACYPRGTFYPLSDGPPTRTTGSLRPGFPPARNVSLAVKLPYAFTLFGWFPISLREPSRAPPLLFRRRPPPVKLPTRQCPRPDYGSELVSRDIQGGISRMAPPKLASRFQRLPPILHKIPQNTLSSCSKGPRVFPSFHG